jgi:hypothetical protein
VTRWNRWNRPGGPSPRRVSRFASLPMASGMAAWQVDATRGHRPVAPVLWFQRYTCLRWNQGDSPRGKNDVPGHEIHYELSIITIHRSQSQILCNSFSGVVCYTCVYI